MVFWMDCFRDGRLTFNRLVKYLRAFRPLSAKNSRLTDFFLRQFATCLHANAAKVWKMSSTQETPNLSRRDALKTGSAIATTSALAGVTIPYVHAANDDPTIRLALVGCGGRGAGAVQNALNTSTEQGPVKLHAMADVFEGNLEGKYKALTAREERARNIDVPPERRFIGFDGFRNAIDTLRPGDVAIFTTPCAFRWVHFAYAIEKGVNVFMEKPVTPDGPATKKMFELNEKAKAKNLKVGIGLMCRHCVARGELADRVQNGEIGEIQLMRAYRMQGPIGSCFSKPNPGDMSDLMYQIKRFHSFLWLSGGSFSDFFIHNIDECCWIKNDWPVEARATGGRHFRDPDHIDQNFDSYSVEYTFGDGTKLYLNGRNVAGCQQEFASFAHGTKGCAVISEKGHAPSRARMYKGQVIHRSPRRGSAPQHPDLLWAYPQEPREPNPYDLEWEALIKAIQSDTEHNEVDRGLKASLVTSMGRMAAHTGQVITYDQILNCEHEFSPNSDKLTLDSDSPIMPDDDGRYPIPVPGKTTDREY